MIKQARFVTSVAAADKLPDYGVPEIAVAGKSNVGKSSFINMLAGQKKLAKTSSEPGRTRLINFFEINKGEYYLVDLPGYGYAKVNRAEKSRWAELIETYLSSDKNLVNVFMLVDIRHLPTDDDLMLIKYLYAYGIMFTVIATKADKLSRMQQQKSRKEIAKALGVGVENVLVTSSQTRQGVDDVYARIDALVHTVE